MTRFNLNAETVPEAAEYFRNRAFQLLANDFIWSGEVVPLMWSGCVWGAETQYRGMDGLMYHSAYVLHQHRGRGHMQRYLTKMAQADVEFVTTGPCKVFEFLECFVPVKLVGDQLSWPEYQMIEGFYGDRCAKRSGLFLMNHVDEGVAILYRMGASAEAIAGFMLHPMVQNDQDLRKNYQLLSPPPLQNEEGAVENSEEIPNPMSLVYAMEYRNIANQFLSPMENHPGYTNPDRIQLSPIPGVNHMLVADKIQNFKDFLAAHRDTHHRSEWLENYFCQWFKRLDISEATYQSLARLITVPKAAVSATSRVA